MGTLAILLVMLCMCYVAFDRFRDKVDEVVGEKWNVFKNWRHERAKRKEQLRRDCAFCMDDFDFDYDDEEDDEDEDEEEDWDDEEVRQEDCKQPMTKSTWIAQATAVYCRLKKTVLDWEKKDSNGVRGKYGAVCEAVDALLGKVDSSIEKYKTVEMFTKEPDSKIADAVALVLENVTPALELVEDHYRRAPYSADNSAKIAEHLRLLVKKVEMLDNYIGHLAKTAVYRPVGASDFRTSFDQGVDNLKKCADAEIAQLQSQIENMRARIKMAENDIVSAEELNKLLTPDVPDAPKNVPPSDTDYCGA